MLSEIWNWIQETNMSFPIFVASVVQCVFMVTLNNRMRRLRKLKKHKRKQKKNPQP